MIQEIIAGAWLGRGWKYRASEAASERVHPGAWRLPFSQALAKHGISLNGVSTLRETIYAFRGKVFWISDPLWGVMDYVVPPLVTLDHKGDDCDSLAWLHACAVQFALGPSGWRGLIVSYLSDPWVYSHHFCAAVDPKGRVWAVQPQPAKWQPQDLENILPEPYEDFARAAMDVADSYSTDAQRVRVVAFDVRDSYWATIEPWRKP